MLERLLFPPTCSPKCSSECHCQPTLQVPLSLPEILAGETVKVNDLLLSPNERRAFESAGDTYKQPFSRKLAKKALIQRTRGNINHPHSPGSSLDGRGLDVGGSSEAHTPLAPLAGCICDGHKANSSPWVIKYLQAN